MLLSLDYLKEINATSPVLRSKFSSVLPPFTLLKSLHPPVLLAALWVCLLYTLDRNNSYWMQCRNTCWRRIWMSSLNPDLPFLLMKMVCFLYTLLISASALTRIPCFLQLPSANTFVSFRLPWVRARFSVLQASLFLHASSHLLLFMPSITCRRWGNALRTVWESGTSWEHVLVRRPRKYFTWEWCLLHIE